jgi:Ca-activated chloride channel family protein
MKSSFPLAGTLLLSFFHLNCGQSVSQTPSNEGKPLPSVSLDSTGAVSWSATAGNKYFSKNTNEFYVYISLKGNEVAQKVKRVPLNISIVLDRSGSMSGDKIAYARRAANFVIDQLKEDDILSIVNYDDKIEVTSPSEPVKNKEVLRKKVNALFDRGSTNLTGGMMEGFEQVKSTKREGYVNRVLLLTDGLANVGITDPQEMKRLVEQRYKQEGIALSTFGLGADYNEDLLTMLAEMGRANYYFIASADKIPDIFANELKGLLSVVAQNAVVQVNFPSNLECVKVYGYPFDAKKNSVTIRFNDVYANDQKGILLKFKPNGSLNESISFTASLKYIDANNFGTVTNDKKIAYSENNNAGLIEQNKDVTVEEMIALYESTEMFDDILARVDAGDYEEARVRAEKAVGYLKVKQQTIKSEKLKKQEESMAVYSKEIDKVKAMKDEDKKLYQKSNKSSNYGVKKGKQ